MPEGTGIGGYPYGEVADAREGDEVSSTYEGRHLTFVEAQITGHINAFPTKGYGCVVGESIVGVALNTATAIGDNVTIDTEGIFLMSVVALNPAAVAVVAGDELFINKTTGIISNNMTEGTHCHFGYALGGVTAGSTAIISVKVHWDPPGLDLDDSIIVVSKSGNDANKGGWCTPILTITRAFALCTDTRRDIFVLPGTYTETAELVWPSINDVTLKGMSDQGQVIINNATAAGAVIRIHPTIAGVEAAYLETLCIESEDQIGLAIDDAHMVAKLMIFMRGVSIESDTGDSMDVVHTSTEAIRIYATDCDFEEVVDIDVFNNGDKFRFMECELIGGITFDAGAFSAEESFFNCIMLATPAVGQATQVLTYKNILLRAADGTTYSDLTPDVFMT